MTTNGLDIFIVLVAGYDPVTASVKTVGFAQKPGHDPETPSNDILLPLLASAGSYEINLFSRGKISGDSEVSFGNIVLDNTNGELDYLRTWGFDGQALTLRYGDRGLDNPTDFTIVFSGTIANVTFTEREITFSLRNRQASLSTKVFIEERYSGDTSSADHVNGTEADLKGLPPPELLGDAGGENISPPLVNQAKACFQISRREIQSIEEVRMKGALVTAGTSRASLAALQAATVTAGTYDYYLGSGSDGAYIRLGSAIDGRVTVKAKQGADAAARTIGQICSNIFSRAGETVESADVTAFDGEISAETGLWIGTDEVTFGDVLNNILSSYRGWWIDDIETGNFRIGWLQLPNSAQSTYTFEDWMLSDSGSDDKIKRIASTEENKDIPVYRVNQQYNKNYTVLSEGDLAGVALSFLEFAKLEWRTIQAPATDDDDSVCQAQTTGGAGNLTINGVDASGGVATMEAGRLVSITSTGNLSAINFTITGTNSNKNASDSQTIAGPNNNTVYTTKYFNDVTQVAVSASVGTNVKVGKSSLLTRVKHLLSAEITRQCLFRSAANAQLAANRNFLFDGAEIGQFEWTCSSKFGQTVKIHDTITINYNRYSETGTEYYRVIGKRADNDARSFTFRGIKLVK